MESTCAKHELRVTEKEIQDFFEEAARRGLTVDELAGETFRADDWGPTI